MQVLPEKEAKAIVSQIFDGLAYLNGPSRRIIHYDLKPANILFDQLGQVKITVRVCMLQPSQPAISTSTPLLLGPVSPLPTSSAIKVSNSSVPKLGVCVHGGGGHFSLWELLFIATFIAYSLGNHVPAGQLQQAGCKAYAANASRA